MKVKAGPLAKEGLFAAGEYTVLAVTIHPKWGIRFVVEETTDSPGLHAPGEVVLTDGHIPRSWRAKFDVDGSFSFEPPEWTSEFWDAYENGDPKAWEIYRAVKKRVEEESP